MKGGLSEQRSWNANSEHKHLIWKTRQTTSRLYHITYELNSSASLKYGRLVLKDCRLSLYLGQRTLDMEAGFYLLGHSFWKNFRTSLVIQWLRVHLSMQRTWVQPLVQEDTICRRATKPMHHSYWVHTLEFKSCSPRFCALQQEKPPRWEASDCN